MVGSMPMQKVVDMLGDAVPASSLDALMALSRPAPADTGRGQEEDDA
jgi:hypothetical protein